MSETPSYQELLPGLGWDVAHFLEPWGIALTLLLVSVLLLEVGMNMAHGLLFRFVDGFRTLDQVLVDGEPAVIASIGLRSTRFRMRNRKNPEEYLPIVNSRLRHVKISKLVFEQKFEDHLHIHHHNKPDEEA